MSNDTVTLLPANSTDLERALDRTTARVGDTPTPLRPLWDADTVTEKAAPWLAWALNVDAWNTDWTLAQKREAIRQSVEVHRRKGTFGAVRRALAAVDYEVSVVEWFNAEPQAAPYTFAAEVIVTNRGVDAATQDEIVRVIYEVKNVRSHLSALRLIGEVSGSMTFAAVTVAAEVTEVKPYTITELVSSGSIFAAAGLVAYDVSSIYPEGSA